MSSTCISRHIGAPRAQVYAALIDAAAVSQWKVPDGMTAVVHGFDAREGGRFRISLAYDAPDAAGKTSAHTDTYHGHFRQLVPNQRVVEVMAFETSDPAMQGEMVVTMVLRDAAGGTRIDALHEGVPPGVAAADNEAGWRMSLDKLAALVEAG